MQSGTTTELNLADWFKANGLTFNPVVFEKQEEADAAYDSGRCDAYTTDASGLYSIRLKLTNPTTTSCCRRSSPRSRSDRRSARATTSGR